MLGPPVMQLLSRQSVPTSFHSGIVSKLPIQAWNKARISPYTLPKMALSKHEKSRRFVVVFVSALQVTHFDWSNLLAHAT